MIKDRTNMELVGQTFLQDPMEGCDLGCSNFLVVFCVALCCFERD